jgi:hypothetical protein
MLLLPVGLYLPGWHPSDRFIPTKDIPTGNSSLRTESVDSVPQFTNASTAVTVPGVAERHLYSGE